MTLLGADSVPSETVTVKVYVPASLNVARVIADRAESLTLKVGSAPDGALVAAQVYVRSPPPPMSSASTLSVVVVPSTGLGKAVAPTRMVGGGSLTVTQALPMFNSFVAATVRS